MRDGPLSRDDVWMNAVSHSLSHTVTHSLFRSDAGVRATVLISRLVRRVAADADQSERRHVRAGFGRGRAEGSKVTVALAILRSCILDLAVAPRTRG